MSDTNREEFNGVRDEPKYVLSLRHFNGIVPEEPLSARRGSDPPGTRHAVLLDHARHIDFC